MMLGELEPNKIGFIIQYVRSLKIIFQNLRKTRDEIKKILVEINCTNAELECKMLILLRNLTNDVYSACEIINEMFISLYRNDERYRGCVLANGFSKNFKHVYNNNVKKEKIKSKIYTDKLLVKFYLQAERWYVILHDIRTQETHYFIGNIFINEDNVYYKNVNRNGISKELYTNPDREINILITDILSLVDCFVETETDLCEIICEELTKL